MQNYAGSIILKVVNPSLPVEVGPRCMTQCLLPAAIVTLQCFRNVFVRNVEVAKWCWFESCATIVTCVKCLEGIGNSKVWFARKSWLEIYYLLMRKSFAVIHFWRPG